MILANAVVVAACGSAKKPAPAPVANVQPAPPPAATSETDEMFAAMERFEREMCACKDAACAQAVSDAIAAWSQEMGDRTEKEPVALSEEERVRQTQIGSHIGECRDEATSP